MAVNANRRREGEERRVSTGEGGWDRVSLHLSARGAVRRCLGMLTSQFRLPPAYRVPVPIIDCLAFCRYPAATAYMGELLQAVARGDRSRVETMIRAGIDLGGVDAPDSSNRPLHWAATFSDAGMVNLLLSHGAQPDAINAQGATALHDAARRGDAGIVQALVRAGASVSIRGLWHCLWHYLCANSRHVVASNPATRVCTVHRMGAVWAPYAPPPWYRLIRAERPGNRCRYRWGVPGKDAVRCDTGIRRIRSPTAAHRPAAGRPVL